MLGKAHTTSRTTTDLSIKASSSKKHSGTRFWWSFSTSPHSTRLSPGTLPHRVGSHRCGPVCQHVLVLAFFSQQRPRSFNPDQVYTCSTTARQSAGTDGRLLEAHLRLRTSLNLPWATHHRCWRMLNVCRTLTQTSGLAPTIPVKLDVLFSELSLTPARHSQSLFLLLHVGVSIIFKGNCLGTLAPKLRLALDHPDDVDATLGKEVSLGHMAGPFADPPNSTLHGTGHLEKFDGTYRMIKHFSAPGGPNVTNGINQLSAYPTSL